MTDSGMDFSVIATAFVVTIVDGTTVQAFGSHLAVLVCPSFTPAAPTTSPLTWYYSSIGAVAVTAVGVVFILVILALPTTASAAHPLLPHIQADSFLEFHQFNYATYNETILLLHYNTYDTITYYYR